MTLAKNFLHKEPDFTHIPRFKLITGILVGLIFSFVFYSFLFLIREVFRILSVTETYDIWILTDKEVHFYNLIFAFIAVIFAQSLTFTFWFDHPKRIFQKQNFRITSIINDQRVLNWYFLSWFSKLAIAFGLLFGLTFHGGFYVFSFYPDHNYLFILIVIVLFIQTWNSIRLVFKRKSLNWLLSSALILSIIALGLSRINLIDYKLINQIYLQKNIHYKYTLELPETGSYEILYRRSLIENIYAVEKKDPQDNSEPVIVVENEEILVERLHEKIMGWQSMRDNYDIPLMVYRLHIHKEIKMDFVNRLKDELIKSGASKIAYAVIPSNHEYDERYYQDYSFPMILPDLNSEWLNPKIIQNDLSEFQNIIEIKQPEAGYLINDTLVNVNQIKSTIKRLIQQNSGYIIKMHVNDSVDFSNYFNVLSSAKAAVDELRNEYADEKFSKKYDSLDFEEMAKVRQLFPFRLFEITDTPHTNPTTLRI